MNRRHLLHAGLAALGSVGLGASALAARGSRPSERDSSGRLGSGTPPAKPFGLHFAPHLGMFRHLAGDDPLDQLRFMADQGFRAFEDNGMAERPVAQQEEIGALLEQLGLRMGVFVANTQGFGVPSFTSGKQEFRDRFTLDMRRAVEVQARLRATWCTVVLGDLDPRLALGYQTANAIEMLRIGAEICEPSGLVMVLEPLNPYRDHPGMFLSRIPAAYELCRAVDSPSCKILFDLYHQQITEGNLIPNIDLAWREIAYFQIGDTPGRNEPTTGEVNFENVFRHIHSKGYDGVLGMEHGNSLPGADGERAVIAAYRAVDVV